MAQYAASNLLTDEEAATVKEIKISTFSNLALCYTKLNQPDKVMDYCQRALALDPNHVKCLIRLGGVQISDKKFDAAKANLMRAYGIDSKNEACLKELRRLKVAHAEWDAVQKEKQKLAFGGKLTSSSG